MNESDPGAGPAGAPETRKPPEPGAPAEPVLALRDVHKSFAAVRALRGVSLELLPGEAHALAGENGAGKSTLIKILAGVHRPDAGELLLDGRPVVFHGPADARHAGIAVIHQEPTLFPDLSVAENIFMGRLPRVSRHSRPSRASHISRASHTSHESRTSRPFRPALGRIDRAAVRDATASLMRRLGVEPDPDRPARGLSIADQQIVEIAKALSFDARVLVMDEPTAALTGTETARLFGVVESLRAEGTAVLFISHRLREIFELCRRVTVLRDGQRVSSEPLAGLTEDDLVHRMVGRELGDLYPKQPADVGETALSVRRLTREGVFRDVSFDVRRGEIVALAGLVGAGRSEVARAVFGIDRPDAGEVRVNGRPLRAGSPAAAMAAGLALVPEDRRRQGLVMDLSIERNIGLTGLGRLGGAGLVRRSLERGRAADWAVRLRLRYGRLSDPAGVLSGGNQQKVVLAKWLATGPSVLVVDEPTRGIDVGTKAEVHRLLSSLAADGLAVLMISSDLPEVLGMADRVLVMHEGWLTAEIPRERATETAVMAAATGLAGKERAA
ncbi:sugar ABC transporter ATP-binding protein [Streptomyces sp. MNU89]|uniref:sugar ABC transporter ATP-binding protein n=1 Tax=Streptomyces sp. MNU89 TaxID=2560025 RepID=UPI001E2CF0A0|nr:sugar ABC transporter ATP-binding protein [Streptomyces sp. MNU89]MCC9740351.1 sugar ABC transporter ATP-binding protein [Streptomyces sp. MNU89]